MREKPILILPIKQHTLPTAHALTRLPSQYIVGEMVLFFFIFLYIASEQKIKIIYTAPIVVLFVDYILGSFKNKNPFWSHQPLLSALFLYTLAFIPAVLLNIHSLYTPVVIRDLLIISAPFIIFLKNPSFSPASVTRLFMVFVLSFLLFKSNYLYIFHSLKSFDLKFILFPTRTSMEFDLGAVFGLFSLFFIYRKQYFWFVISFVIILLTGKRVILFAMIPALALQWTILKHLTSPRSQNVFLGVVFFGGAVTSALLPELASLVSQLLGIPIPVNVLLMGRDKPVFFLREAIFESGSFIQMLWGHGPGMADYILGTNGVVSWAKGMLANPHNDYLKLLYDYGIVGIILYFFAALKTFAQTPESRLAWVYTMFVYAVDNSLIFSVYLISLGVLSYCKNDSTHSTPAFQPSANHRLSYETT